MDLRIKAIRNALIQNSEEVKKWTQYKEEHITLEKNLKEYQKHLEIEVMVPVGSKALIPGVLYHTNEILVSHFQGLFSKVSTQKALEIVKHRIRISEEHLKSLVTESNLYENQIELPLLEEAFNESGKEIIEEYDEERENQWKEQHRLSIQKMKIQEANERQKSTKVAKEQDKGNVLSMLEEYELMEELENELGAIDVVPEDDGILNKLINGEIDLKTEKPRISHVKSKTSIPEDLSSFTSNSRTTLTTYTNNNHIANQQDYNNISDNDSNSSDDIPTEYKKLAESVKDLSKKEKLKVYKKKLSEIKMTIRGTVISDELGLIQKINDLELKETLEDVIDELADDLEEASSEEEEFLTNNVDHSNTNHVNTEIFENGTSNCTSNSEPIKEKIVNSMDNEHKKIEQHGDSNKKPHDLAPLIITKPQGSPKRRHRKNSNGSPNQRSRKNSGSSSPNSDNRRISFSKEVQIEYIHAIDAPIKISKTAKPVEKLKPQPKEKEKEDHFHAFIEYDPDLTMHIKYSHTTEKFDPPKFEKDIIGNPREIYLKYKVKGKKKHKRMKRDSKSEDDTHESDELCPSPTEQKPIKPILKNCKLVEHEIHHKVEIEELSEVEIEEFHGKSLAKRKLRTNSIGDKDVNSILNDVLEAMNDMETPQKTIELEQPKKMSRFKASRQKK